MPRRKSQLSSSQVEESITDEMVQDVVTAVLVLDNKKRPIKRADLLSHLKMKPKRNDMGKLWEGVDTALDELGFELRDYMASKGKCCLLIAKDPDAPEMYKYLSKEERADRTLLFLILTFIFMKDDEVSEEDLFRHLGHLQIDMNMTDHAYFGDVKKSFGRFVDQAYLDRFQSETDSFIVVSWGERAHHEVSKLSILEFVCKIGFSDRMKPENWVSHYQKANDTVPEDD